MLSDWGIPHINLFIVSLLINIYLLAKVIEYSRFIKKQQSAIYKLERTLRDWQRTHLKCIDQACMEKILNDIIGGMK